MDGGWGQDTLGVINVEIDIDFDHAEKIVKDINRLERRFEMAVESGIYAAQEAIERKLIQIMVGYDLNKLIKDIFIFQTPTGFIVEVISEQAVYVEYGTGIRGKNNAHPTPIYEYNVPSPHKRGRVGNEFWFAPLDELDPNEYKNQVEGKPYAWTQGRPSKPYFYDLVRWIKSYGIITRSIRKELRKL